MKKLYSLISASMTSDMNLFKIKTKKNSKTSSLIPIFIALYLMFMIWGSANSFFGKLEPLHLQYLLLPLSVFGISIMTIIEGIYKSSSLIFNSKDDDLLLSLPIKKSTILFLRVFKFYVFELMFNSMFLLPIMIAYIRWAEYLSWTYYLTSFIMIFTLPLIPIIMSSIIGVIITSVSNKFKYKNLVQIITSMLFLVMVLCISYNMDSIFNYLVSHATSLNDLITKLYYPAGIYAKLVINYNWIDLLVYIILNIVIFMFFIYILSLFYFKINSGIKKVTTNSNIKLNKLKFKKNNKYISLIKKEINTFFKTPVFIINAGFGLVLFIIISIITAIKFNSVLPILTSKDGLNMSISLINNNLSILIFMIIIITSYMTSITNSVVSLEGRNINILKTLPISTKSILMSKIYSSLLLTTSILLLGDIILFIRFKINIIESIMLLILSILIPLVSHFIGIIVNLKYPKLDYENSTEVVKQSASSFISVMLGMILLIINIVIITNILGVISAKLMLFIFLLIYIFIDIVLYLYLVNNGVKNFNKLTI